MNAEELYTHDILPKAHKALQKIYEDMIGSSHDVKKILNEYFTSRNSYHICYMNQDNKLLSELGMRIFDSLNCDYPVISVFATGTVGNVSIFLLRIRTKYDQFEDITSANLSPQLACAQSYMDKISH